MTQIDFERFDKALDRAKESCRRIGAVHPTDPAVNATLNHLILAIEMLADAIEDTP